MSPKQKRSPIGLRFCFGSFCCICAAASSRERQQLEGRLTATSPVIARQNAGDARKGDLPFSREADKGVHPGVAQMLACAVQSTGGAENLNAKAFVFSRFTIRRVQFWGRVNIEQILTQSKLFGIMTMRREVLL